MNSSSPEELPEPKRSYGLIDAFVVGIIILVLAALGSTLIPGGRVSHDHMQCANHLSQLYKLGMTYCAAHRGRWPDAQGEALWIEFSKGTVPLIDVHSLEVLFCPVKGDEMTGDATDYRGPAGTVTKPRSGDPVGADKPANHGHKHGGNVLRADGCVTELEIDDPEWRRCEMLLRP